jgi:hypothetical protein
MSRRNGSDQKVVRLEPRGTRLAADPARVVNRPRRANVVTAINVERRGSVRVATAHQAAPIVQDGPASR